MKRRSVVEVMVLTFTAVVAISMLGLSFTIVYVKVRYPDADVDRLSASLSSLLSAIVGALLGLLAGRSRQLNDALHGHDRGDEGVAE
ncbi:MAG TPA: hypothetical protein VLE97_07950 [Gaiellaceae bacterium]|nr:hypothetical protein [Gaiellaceae bacterium]